MPMKDKTKKVTKTVRKARPSVGVTNMGVPPKTYDVAQKKRKAKK